MGKRGVTHSSASSDFFSVLQFCHNNKKAQKYLLGGFECLVKLFQTQLLPRVPVILKDLYDADLLEEDVILAWAEVAAVARTLARRTSSQTTSTARWRKARTAVAPFSSPTAATATVATARAPHASTRWRHTLAASGTARWTATAWCL